MDTLKVWKPEPGDVLHGTLQEAETVRTKYGPTIKAVILEEETTEPVLLWVGSAVLKAEWQKAQPKPGERLAVKYIGRQGQAERQYHVHAVEVFRETIEGELPWEIAEKSDDKRIATEVLRKRRGSRHKQPKEQRERVAPAYDAADPFC